MSTETRTRSLTRTESLFAPDVPVEERQKSLIELDHLARPDQDTIAAVIPLLNDADETLKNMAANVLSHWGQQAVTMLLQALRSTAPMEVQYRLAIIQQLKRMGPMAVRAETLLRNLQSDPDVGAAASDALSAVRMDMEDLATRLIHHSGELLLLACAVAAPVIAMRMALPPQALPPLGFTIGMASLVVVGLMLARFVYADDLFHRPIYEETVRPTRMAPYLLMVIGGAVIGTVIALVHWACGGMIQQWFK